MFSFFFFLKIFVFRHFCASGRLFVRNTPLLSNKKMSGEDQSIILKNFLQSRVHFDPPDGSKEDALRRYGLVEDCKADQFPLKVIADRAEFAVVEKAHDVRMDGDFHVGASQNLFSLFSFFLLLLLTRHENHHFLTHLLNHVQHFSSHLPIRSSRWTRH